MSGLAIMARAWEEAGRPESWECFMLGHLLATRARAARTDTGHTARVAIFVQCTVCREGLGIFETYDLRDYVLAHQQDAKDDEIIRRLRSRLMQRDRRNRGKPCPTP